MKENIDLLKQYSKENKNHGYRFILGVHKHYPLMIISIHGFYITGFNFNYTINLEDKEENIVKSISLLAQSINISSDLLIKDISACLGSKGMYQELVYNI